MAADLFADVDAGSLAPVPARLFLAARREQCVGPSTASERRQTARFYIAVEAVARPLAANGTPAGRAFRAVIADVSNGGLRLLYSDALETPLLAVRVGLTDDCVVVVVRVIRSVQADSHYEHAGPFFVPLDTDRLCDRIFELAGVRRSLRLAARRNPFQRGRS